MSVSDQFPKSANAEINDHHWKFLHAPWPQIIPEKYHRIDLKMVNDIDHIKETVLQRLSYIPVFFFLSVVFGTKYYPGPHGNVEKGL